MRNALASFFWMCAMSALVLGIASGEANAQTSELTVEVNWVSWSSDNKVEVYDPSGALIFEVCDPVNCETTTANTSYSETFNIGCYANANNYYIIATDAFGDGWNGTGNYVRINSGGSQVLNYDLTSGSTSGQQFFNVSGGGTCPSDDAGVDEITAPVSGCQLSATETVTIVLRNQGTTTITSCPIQYSLDGISFLSAGTYTGSITAGNTDTYDFSLDLSAEGNYSLTVVAILGGDANSSNDTVSDYTFNNTIPHDFTGEGSFTMGFETTDDYNGWTTLNLNGDAAIWDMTISGTANSGSRSARYNYSSSNAADDWMFTPCLSLNAGSTYELTYYYRVQSGSYPEDFAVRVTNAQDESSTVSTIESLTNLTNTTYTESQNTFTVSTTGTYYLAWEATSSADQWNIFIDDIDISLVVAQDAYISSVDSPTDGCDLSASETVQVTIMNGGTSAISNIPVEYRIDGGSWQSGGTHVGSIASGGTSTHTFSADLSNPGVHTIDARTQLSGDQIPGNDSLIGYSVTNESFGFDGGSFTYGFEASEDFSNWVIENTNGDNRQWEITTANPNNGSQSIRIRQSSSAANDWLFLPCSHFETGENYYIDFYYRVRNTNFQENMEVHLCTAQVSTATVSTLETFSNFSNNTYTLGSVPFTVSSSGTYYLAFRATSAASRRGIHLDDINVYSEENRWLGYSTSWSDNSNWSNNAVPTSNSIVVIPSSPEGGNLPSISGGSNCADLTINSGADIDFGGSGSLSVTGDIDGSFDLTAGQITMDGAAAQTISGNCTFHDLSIDNSNGVTLTSGAMGVRGTLDLVDGELDLNSNDLTIISDAAGDARIGPVASGSIDGDVTVQRYIDAGSTNWRFMCSPVSSVDFEAWDDDFITSGFTGSDYPNFYFTSIYSYDESMLGDEDLGYVPLSNSNQSINVGEGYWVWCGDQASGTNPFTVDVTGPIVTGSVNLNVSYTNSGSAVDDGWTMVGNPYACEINWDTAGWTKTNINNAIYIWDPDASQYASYVGGVGVNGGTRYIASGQAFWVQANGTSPQLTSTESVKTRTAPGFWRPSVPSTHPELRLTISSSSSTDETLIRFAEEGSQSFEPTSDAQKLYSVAPGIPNMATYSVEGTPQAINTYGSLDEDVSIPIEVLVGSSGTYELKVKSMEHFDATSCILLEDLETGEWFDLESTAVITRQLSASTTNPRFMLHVTAPMRKEVTPVSCHGEDDGRVEVNIASKAGWNFYLRNEKAQTVDSSLGVIGSGRVQFDSLAPGLYFISTESDGLCPAARDTFRITEPDLVDAQFEVLDDRAQVGTPVHFANYSSGATTYQWRFGDGTQSANPEPVHSYERERSFVVTLQAMNDNGCLDVYGQIVKVGGTLGQQEVLTSDQVTLYGDGQLFQLQFNFSEARDLNIRLLDQRGAQVRDWGAVSSASQRMELDLSTLSAGVYLLDISGKDYTSTLSVVVR